MRCCKRCWTPYFCGWSECPCHENADLLAQESADGYRDRIGVPGRQRGQRMPLRTDSGETRQ